MKINIYSRKSLHTSYSCILYLKKELEKYGNVTLWSHTPENSIGKEYKNNSHSFYDCWYGKLRGVRVYLAKIQCFVDALKGEQVLVIHDLDFFIEAFLASKINRKLKVVHYNTEIHGSDVKYPRYVDLFYKRHADFPDIIIECLNERAVYRKKKYKIRKNIYVINNTLPRININLADMDIDVEKLHFKEKLPILIYAGGCDKTRGLGVVMDAMTLLEGTCNFLFFLDNSNIIAYNDTLQECEVFLKRNICHIYPAIERAKLFKYMRLCDVGLNYYNPALNANHKYASPTKFYEYMANGLKIITTNNEGINKIVKKEGIGLFFNRDSDFVAVLKNVLTDEHLKTRNQIQALFNSKYCYEVSSKKAIDAIYGLMSRG